MEGVGVLGILSTQSAAARTEVVTLLTEVMEYAKANEPGVTTYFITTPKDDDKMIYVFEMYKDQEACDDHMKIPPVEKLIGVFTSDKSPLAGAPNVLKLKPVSGFTRISPLAAHDPYIAYSTVTYAPKTSDEGIAGWKAVAEATEKDKSKLLSFNYFLVQGDENRIVSLGVYESKQHFDVHAKKETPKDKTEDESTEMEGVEYVLLKMEAGYLSK